MSHVLFLGGDGYLGWPTEMYFSIRGHEVTVVDNYFRRNACKELDTGMLYPIPSLTERAKIWHSKTGNEIKVVLGDLSDPELMRSLFTGKLKYDWSLNNKFTGIPETVVHYAEQPSAPYSLINHKYADFTLVNNLRVTNNLMWSLRDYSRETHVIKLGTMGDMVHQTLILKRAGLKLNIKKEKINFYFLDKVVLYIIRLRLWILICSGLVFVFGT